MQPVHFNPLIVSKFAMPCSILCALLIDRQCLQFIPSMSPTQRRSDSPRLDKTANNNKAALPGNVKQPVLKEFIMNTKQLFAAAAFAVIGTSAFAVEAEQIVPQSGQLTRAEVQAQVARAQVTGELTFAGDSYGGFKAVTWAARKSPLEHAATRSRDEVREEARAAGRASTFNQLYVGG
ncbi:MAG: DUF4148 domain-containing protein [Piscinibacter sp.]|nr:DUF4148 domain-containing protein [Piscinibacter sp.]